MLMSATALSLVAACAQMPASTINPSAIDEPGHVHTIESAMAPIELQGQVAVKLGAWGQDPARGVSFGFFYQGQVDAGGISLMTPLGSQVAQIDWTRTSATLKRVGPGGSEEIRAGNVDELAEAALGEALPLRTLTHWMQGQPDPIHPHASASAPSTFMQLGWLVDTSQHQQGRILAIRHGQPGRRDARILVRLDP
jgi:outer membrane biogenesis lipoprotein LolB